MIIDFEKVRHLPIVDERPYPGEHSARLKDPKQYFEFRRENNKFGSGIHAIWGIKKKDGKRVAELQAIRFDAKKFTVAEAKKWLKDHNYKYILFEPAKEGKSMDKIIKSGILFRTEVIDRGTINKDDRTVQLSFSSETPVERWFGKEVLDHDNKSIRLKRLRKGGPLLVDHLNSVEKQPGVVEDVIVGDDRKGRASVRFGKDVFSDEIFQKVSDGVIQNVSVGYRIHKMILEEKDEDNPLNSIYRAVDWEPLEISLVAMPADISVGIGRKAGEEKEIEVINQKKEEGKMEKCSKCDQELSQCTCQKSTQIDIDKVQADARKAEKTRVSEILAIGEKHKCPTELTKKAIDEGKSTDEFRQEVLETVYKAKPVEIDPNIGMTDKEIQMFSIVRAIRQITEKGHLVDGLEKEASEATAKICKHEPKGFFIPQDVMGKAKLARAIATAERVLAAGDATKGGYLVGADVLVADMIELLRNKALVSRLGAKTLSGLVGNVAIPRVTGGGTAYWLPEDGEVTTSDQAFGQLGLTPKKLVGDTAYQNELIMQTSLDVEGFVREDLMTVLAIAKDLGAINGLGAEGQPVGILNTTGIKTVTFGAAPTWAKVVDFETQLADANADVRAMAYLTTPAVRGKWKTTVKVTNQAIFLWEKGSERGVGDVNGYPAYATKQVPSDKVIFGNWSDLILAEWAGIDVVVDPYSLKKKGQIEITITLYCDIGVRHAVSFCASTDSGAQ